LLLLLGLLLLLLRSGIAVVDNCVSVCTFARVKQES
jgi:hypothetical protein